MLVWVVGLSMLLALSGSGVYGRAALMGSAEQVLEQHYHSRAALHPRDEQRLEELSADYSAPHSLDEVGEDEEEEEGQADMPSAPSPPPPPPYDAVFLQIEQQIAAHEAADARTAASTKAKAQAKAKATAVSGGRVHSTSAASSAQRMRLRGEVRAAAKTKTQDPFPDQPFTYKDVSSPPDWLVPEKSEPAGPTTKPPPVPQMIPPPPPVPFPTYNYHDPNSAGPFSQYAPGVQGWGYDGGYAGPYDGYSMYGHSPNPGQTRGWMNPSVPRTAAQISAATAASQYHPYGAPPPLYSLGSPPPDGASSWVPLGAFLKPGTLEGGAGEE